MLSTLVERIDRFYVQMYELVGGGVSSGKVRSYNLVNLNAGIDNIFNRISLTCRINNLFNQKYYNAGTANTVTFAESPQNPREFFLSLRFNF